MRTTYSRPLRVEILETSSSKVFAGQEATLVFQLDEHGRPSCFFLRDEHSHRAFYRSGDIVGAVVSAFENDVMEIGTLGPSFHLIRFLDEDADFGFTPKVVATVGRSGARFL